MPAACGAISAHSAESANGQQQRRARNKDHIGGLAKGLRLLEAFDAAHARLTVTEAARSVDISQASARRCLLTLCELGYAQTTASTTGSAMAR